MIIDGHNYCVPQMDAPQGYDTAKRKLTTIQTEFAGHHQSVWRVRDRAPASNDVLADPKTLKLRDVRWTRHLGRLAWEYEGELYTKQYLPPMLSNLEFGPEMLIAEMDYAGVDMGLLHTYATLGHYTFTNEYLGEAVRRFPDRLMRLIAVREASIPSYPEKAVEEVRREVETDGGRTGLQFVPGFYYHPTDGESEGHAEPWDDGKMRPFWEAVARMNIPVFFTLIGGRTLDPEFRRDYKKAYLREQEVLIRWMERYPQVTAVITHGLPWLPFQEGSRIVFPKEIWKVFESPRCYMQLLIPIQMGGRWEYPWKEAEPTVQDCVERVGVDRLMWGTDIPMVGRFCTYRQALDQFRIHCQFLTDEERKAILGGTTARVMGLSPQRL